MLSFAIDDYIADSFDTLCVQAKDLAIYIINYERHEVVTKASNVFVPINRMSIFFNNQRSRYA